jgi:hypothetical protein
MTDTQNDPLQELLTDIAQGVALLVERVDAIEDRMAVQHINVSESLATIAEIATRNYFASKPPNALPDDVINTAVMDAMIDRWSMNWVMRFPKSEFDQLKNLATISVEEIEAQLRARAAIEEFATNVQRLRHARALFMLNEEMAIRAKALEKDMERDTPGRSR